MLKHRRSSIRNLFQSGMCVEENFSPFLLIRSISISLNFLNLSLHDNIITRGQCFPKAKVDLRSRTSNSGALPWAEAATVCTIPTNAQRVQDQRLYCLLALVRL
jgi:hypothetical protein